MIGEEVSTLNGHVVALYLEERVPAGLSADRTLELVHAQGGLASPRIPSTRSAIAGRVSRRWPT